MHWRKSSVFLHMTMKESNNHRRISAFVMPAEAGIRVRLVTNAKKLDSGVRRRNDGSMITDGSDVLLNSLQTWREE